MFIKLIVFLIEILIFMSIIKRFIPLKEISKIGLINLLLIIIYIIENIYYFCNKLGYLPNLPYHYYIDLIILLLIFYRLIYLNIAIDYTFKKDEKTFRYFHQNDIRWRNIPYGISTIGKTGCGLSILAMIHSIIDKNITPKEVGKWVNENYPQTGGTNIDTLVKYLNCFNIENKYLPREANLSSEIKSNNVICVWWKNYPDQITKFKLLSHIFGSGHYVLLYEIHGNKAYIADPDNYAGTVKSIKLTKLMKKVNNHPKDVTHPYISVCYKNYPQQHKINERQMKNK